QGRVIEEGKPSALLTSSNISGKFQFTGEIVKMQAEGVISILTILVGKELIKVVSERDEAKNLSIGDKVLVASKAFNPIIQRIN
ncbi:MAG: molybdate transport system ATP-binding protein, partial [Nonlabens sp.]